MLASQNSTNKTPVLRLRNLKEQVASAFLKKALPVVDGIGPMRKQL
jgi:hypothetical protein